MADYFSSRFQFYGRKLKIDFFKGQGNGADELLGGGKENALADAVHVGQGGRAPSPTSAASRIPYADALARNGVVNFGAPYPSSEWFVARRPYAWSLFPDGTNVVNSSAAATLGRLGPPARPPSTAAPTSTASPGSSPSSPRRTPSTRSR